MKHEFVDHKDGCPNENRGCIICDGGLALCKVCGGAEGALPTECPERRMTAEEIDSVYKGILDFKHGKWIEGISINSPMFISLLY